MYEFFIKNALSSSDWIESFNNRQERHLTTGEPGPDHISTFGVLTLPSLQQVQDVTLLVFSSQITPTNHRTYRPMSKCCLSGP